MLKLAAPPPLRKGDTIAVVAPAGPVPMARLAPGLALLERDYNLLVADDIDRREQFLAGSDARRAEEFNEVLRNPEVRAIWAARGGYGCTRIIDDLDEAAFAADPIPIVGFSDITVLLCWAAVQGFRSIHGPVLTQLGELGVEDVRCVLGLLEGQGSGDRMACHGEAQGIQGIALGGNLSLLSHLCGTPWALALDGAICLLEDVGERPYAVDRYLSQMLSQEHRTSLKSAAAVVLGDLHRCEEPGTFAGTAWPSTTALVLQRLRRAGLSCSEGLPIGHGSRNRAFAFGAQAALDSQGLVFLEPATEG